MSGVTVQEQSNRSRAESPVMNLPDATMTNGAEQWIEYSLKRLTD